MSENVNIEYQPAGRKGKAKVVLHNSTEHIQSFWAKGVFYEAYRNGVLNWMWSQRGRWSGKAVIDVGANRGNHTIFAAKILDAPLVVAFEPNGDCFAHLEENIALNRIKSRTSAVNLSAWNENAEDATIRLDDWWVAADPAEDLGLVKIDTDGAECEVLAGMPDLLANHKPDIIVECRGGRDNYPTVDALLRAAGYLPITWKNQPIWWNKDDTLIYTHAGQ